MLFATQLLALSVEHTCALGQEMGVATPISWPSAQVCSTDNAKSCVAKSMLTCLSMFKFCPKLITQLGSKRKKLKQHLQQLKTKPLQLHK